MPIYEITAPDGKTYEIEGPPGASRQDVIKAIIARNPMAVQTTAELEAAKSAPFSFGDVAKSFSSGLIGGGKSLVDVFGAGTDVSKGLGEAQSYLQQSLTPERQAEIAKRQELESRAAKSGSLFQEAKAFLGGVTEAPIQSLTQAAGSSVPSILTSIAALPAGAPVALALGVRTIAELSIGALQGVGEYKGSVFDAVKAEYIRQGKSPVEADQLAKAAQEYSREKAFEIGGSAVLGALDAATGVEPSIAKAIRKASPTGALSQEAIDAGISALPRNVTKAPTMTGQLAKGIATEAPLEGAQGAFGQYGQNVALQQAGADVSPMEGVLGAGLRDAAVGALFGGAASPLSMKSARQEYETEQFLRQAKVEQDRQREAEAALKRAQEERARVEEGLGVPKMLALPAPNKPYEEPKNPLVDPVGRVTEDELGKAIGDNTVVNYINKYRKENNLPKLKSYSIEDIKDAMTAQNPEGEEGALNAILAYKTNYQNQEYTPQDIQNIAVAKNVATETKGFSDFLTRATGKADLNTMTQPELHSVATALDALQRTGKEEQLVLPEGSNATRFTQDQYNTGLTTALGAIKPGKPVSLEQAKKAVQAQTGLETDRDAESLLRTAVINDDLTIDRGTGYQAISPTGAVLGTYGTESEAKRMHRRAEIKPVETELVTPRIEEATRPETDLPEGYQIQKEDTVGSEAPAAYVIREDGSQKNASQTFSDEADAKERLNILARKREANAAAEEAAADRVRQDLEKRQAAIAQMEADGKTGTPEHTKAVYAFQAANVAGSQKFTDHLDKAAALRTPLKIVPLGKKSTKVAKHTVIKEGKVVASFDTNDKAQAHVLSLLNDKDLGSIVKRGGTMGQRAKVELDMRERPGVRGGTTAGLEAAGVRTPEVEAKLAELKAKLKPLLDKFGMGDVALNIVREIENDADGAWGRADKLIRIALQATDPIKTMRHEALHALKELGFFTPQQWEALKREAKKTWVDKYLKNVAYSPTMSRYDAYANGLQDENGKVLMAPLSEEDLLEEAIADAFGDWEGGAKPPPGMMAALFKRMQQFFSALRQALTGAGFESADEIFGKIERGELKAGKQTETEGEKYSLSGVGVPMSTRSLMEVQTPVAQQELGLNTEAKRGRFNNVREIAKALNQYTLDHIGEMDRNNLTQADSTKIAKAIADEVAFQLNATSKTGTGLGWYSNNYPNAVKRLSKRFPELGTNQHARSVFSAIVAVTSNGEKVAKNIDNAIKLYADLRAGKRLVAMSNRRATALENNLAVIEMLLAKHNQDFEKVLLKEITVKEMNARLREMGEKDDGSYLANTVVPAAAVYFGPKLGAFYANLSGSEGYLTMDLWWTRSINRMRGLLIPQATDASINKFRDMMDRPDATRDEVVAATIPLRNKYEEFGWNTELEHLVGAKEPATKEDKPKWFKQAEKAAGDAYEQLLFDHSAEKMANTIYKNEFEMLKEDPFTASDRKFMYDAARKAQSMLQKEGVDLTLADIQAALWYYEKRLYEKLSGRKADDIGYEEAIIAQANQGNGRARPSVVFDKQSSGGAEPAGTSAEATGVRGEPTGGDQKLSLRQVKDIFDRAEGISEPPGVESIRQQWIGGVSGIGDRDSMYDLYRVNGSKKYIQDVQNFVRKELGDDFKGYRLMSNDELEEIQTGAMGSQFASFTLNPDVARAFKNIPAYAEKTGMSVVEMDLTPEHVAMIGHPGELEFVVDYGQGYNPSDVKVVEKYSLRAPDTKEFKQFFAGSKVVNEDGSPKVMYHGTRKDFNIFRKGLIFSSPDPMVANKFAANDMLYSPDKPGIEPGANVMPVYIKADNPFDYENPEHVDALFDKIKNLFDKSSREAGKRAISQGRFTLIEDERFVDAIKELGHDGLYVEEFGEKNLAVFESNQVKSATGNLGTFDATNADIRYSLPTYFPTAEEAEQAAYKKAAPSTPEFKRFFGASKVKEEGRPQVMYHGSLNDFTQFNEDNRKGLIFVTPSPAFAEEYALLHASRMEKQAEPPIKVYPLWVRAETPFDYENPVHVDRVMNEFGGTMGMNEYIQTEKEVKEGNWSKIEDPRFVATLKRLGFDSLYVKENRTKNLAVFSANQVKSVTGNIGEFGENKDIRYSLRSAPTTPEFKRWFTSSKVVNEDGSPKVMYHGTNKDFNKFLIAEKANRDGMPDGFYFTSDAEDASRYAKGEGANVMPVYLSIKNPYNLGGKNKISKEMVMQFRDELRKDNPDLGFDWIQSKVEAFKKYTAAGSFPFPNVSFPTDAMQRVFEVGGYDGLIDGDRVFVAFNPSQVKSATGNTGAFDRVNPDIRYSLPTQSAAYAARRDETTTRRENKGVIDSILESFAPESMANLRAAFIHRYNQLGVIDKMLAEKMGGKVLLADVSAEAAANMSDLSSSVTYSAFGIGNRKGGIPVYKNGATTIDNSVKGPLEILAPLAQFNDPVAYQDYQYWAGVQRGKRFMADGREKNFEAGDIALVEESRKKYLAKGVDFRVIQKEMNTFNDGVVNYMIATGVISAERGAEFKKHMDYIPFFRQVNGDTTVGPKIFNSISGVKPPKKLKGSEAPLTDYLESIVRNTQAAINAGMKNVAAQRAVNVAMQLGPKIGAQRLNVIDNAPDTVQVMENGKQVSYRVADQLFINAVKNLNMSEMPFLGFLSGPADLLRNLVTKDPGFMLANMARDSLSAWTTSGVNITPIASTAANFAKALGGKSATYNALLNGGILGGYEFSTGLLNSANVLEADLNKKYGSKGMAAPLGVFKGVWDALERGTEASDAATRMAVYDRVLEETGNETEALYRALEVMNFNRKGSSPVARILTAAIPFLNARIQGLDVLYRTAFGKNVTANNEAMQKAFFVRGMTLMALSAAYFLAVSDDEEWKKQEQETKDNYWIFPGVGKFPTPFEVGFVFKTVPERIMAYYLKDDTGQDLMNSMRRGLLNTFAFNPIPQVAKPLVEYAANYNFFTGRPIVGQGLEGREVQYQVGPTTTHSMEWLGKQLGLSPIKLEQVYGGYTGTMGMYALTLFDSILNTQAESPNASKRFEQLPVFKRFAADPEARGNITQFYELKRSVDAAVETQNYLLRAGSPKEFEEFMERNAGLLASKQYVASIEKTMKGMREMRKMVDGAQMTADEKSETLIAIGQAENDMTQNIQTVKKMISEL